MNSNDQFGCGLLVAILVVAGIAVGVMGAFEQRGLKTRIEQLENRTEYQTWWYGILDREYNKLRKSHEQF